MLPVVFCVPERSTDEGLSLRLILAGKTDTEKEL